MSTDAELRQRSQVVTALAIALVILGTATGLALIRVQALDHELSTLKNAYHYWCDDRLKTEAEYGLSSVCWRIWDQAADVLDR